jgi:beta-galactosidase/beta-glucuronidase
MTALITDLVQPRLLVAADGEARLLLVDASAGGRDVISLHGTLDGPNCLHARTLPTVFRLHARRDPESGAASAAVLVTDPCDWTPTLPFLYTLIVELQLADGTEMTVSQPLALRRWYADGPNLRLERKRVVLRGAEVTQPDAALVPAAHGVETALLVREPELAFCREANRQTLRSSPIFGRLEATPAALACLCGNPP